MKPNAFLLNEWKKKIQVNWFDLLLWQMKMKIYSLEKTPIPIQQKINSHCCSRSLNWLKASRSSFRNKDTVIKVQNPQYNTIEAKSAKIPLS